MSEARNHRYNDNESRLLAGTSSVEVIMETRAVQSGFAQKEDTIPWH